MSETVEIKSLYSEGQFPVEIAKAVGVNLAEAVARLVGSSHSYAFGVKGENLAAMLRFMADEVDAKRVAVQGVAHVTRATQDDFVMHWLTIEFAHKSAKPPE